MSVPPSLNIFPFGEQKVHLQCIHKDLEVKILLTAGFSIFSDVFWMGFRNEEQWILQDALGISICLHELKEFTYAIWRIKADFFWHCHLWSLPRTDCSFTSQVRGQHSRNYDSWTTWCGTPHYKKIQPLLKIPVWYPTSGCNRSFTVLVLEDTVTPGPLVAYFHKFYIQTLSSWIYFVNPPAGGLMWSAGKLWSFSINTDITQLISALYHTFLLLACLLLFWTSSWKRCEHAVILQGSAPILPQKSVSATLMPKKTQIHRLWLEEHTITHIPNKDQLDNLCWKKKMNVPIQAPILKRKTLYYPEKNQAPNTDLQWNLDLQN